MTSAPRAPRGPRPQRPRGRDRARAPRRTATGDAGARTTCSAPSTSSTPAKRVDGGCARARRQRRSRSSQSFDTDGPQKGWRRRTNPVHTMTDTGTDAERGNQGFPHGIGGADDVIAMPLQCSTQWDGLGHIFDHGYRLERPPGGRRRHQRRRPRHGHRARGMPSSSRAGSCSTSADTSRPTPASSPTATRSPPPTSTRAPRRRASSVGRGDIVLVRTGQLARARRDGWGDYAGGPARGCRSPPPGGCTAPRSPPSRPTPGASRCGRTSSTCRRSSPCTRSSSRTSVSRSARCGTSTSSPTPAPSTATLGVPALGAAAADHRSRRVADEPPRPPLTAPPSQNREVLT